MKRLISIISATLILMVTTAPGIPAFPAQPEDTVVSAEIQGRVIEALVEKNGEQHRARIESGVARAASLWWSEDGSGEEFAEFCRANFIADAPALEQAFKKLDAGFELLQGRLGMIGRELQSPFTLDRGAPQPVDRVLRDAVPGVDPYGSRLAFFVALNFPRYTLEEKLEKGPEWTRLEWAMARVGDLYPVRIPRDASAEARSHRGKSGNYLRDYFIPMDRVLTPDQETIFPDGFRLHSHHGLRDTVKELYTQEGGFPRQEMIQNVIMRIVDQTIPLRFIDGEDLYWEPVSNHLLRKEGGDYVAAESPPEGSRRYQVLLNAFHARRVEDPFHPDAPTYIRRTFNARQMTEARVEELIRSVIGSEEAAMVADLIQKRLGRPLQPFDIWYSGFQAQSDWSADELNAITRKKYPRPEDFQADLPHILMRLGFPREQARFLGYHVVVDPVKSGGHSAGAAFRGDRSHLRTVFGPEGMDYKSFRIGMHETGHTVHQNLTRYGIEYYFLSGLPMSGFSEAIAELLAYRNIQALGLRDEPDPREAPMQALASFYYLFEMGGNALTDMKTWRWMYEHPEADAEQLRDAVLEIARSVWNEYYAPLFGVRDVPILSIYNHMISGALYLHSYFLGNVIMFQIYDHMPGRDFASELERMCRQGRLTPDLWMERAVGRPISSEPLLRAVRKAVDQ